MSSSVAQALKSAAFLLSWGVAMWGVLQLRLIPNSCLGGIGVCGPWGCGPPITALAAWHGFWFVCLAWPAAWMWFAVPTWLVRWIGATTTALGTIGIGGIVVYEWATYLPSIAEGESTYFLQRCLFSVVTMVDLPILPFVLVGTLLLCLSWLSQGSLWTSAASSPVEEPVVQDAPYA